MRRMTHELSFSKEPIIKVAAVLPAARFTKRLLSPGPQAIKSGDTFGGSPARRRLSSSDSFVTGEILTPVVIESRLSNTGDIVPLDSHNPCATSAVRKATVSEILTAHKDRSAPSSLISTQFTRATHARQMTAPVRKWKTVLSFSKAAGRLFHRLPGCESAQSGSHRPTCFPKLLGQTAAPLAGRCVDTVFGIVESLRRTRSLVVPARTT
jgi:hypothetical protein